MSRIFSVIISATEAEVRVLVKAEAALVEVQLLTRTLG